MIKRSLESQVVVTQRMPTGVVEPMEPRYLLSGDLMVVPPAPEQPSPEPVINLALEAEKSLVAAARPVDEVADTEAADTLVDQVIFVDQGVENADTLIQQVLSNSALDSSRYEVVFLDGLSDGVEQVGQWLSRYQDLNAVHLISHGADGQISLGNTVLEQATLERYGDVLARWGEALSDQGDILIYGCSVAGIPEGEALVQALADLTGADVAASDDLTGSETFGGDWELEVRAGLIDVSMLLDGGSWQGLLADFTSDSTDENFTGTATDDRFVFGDDWGSDAATGAGGNDTLDFSGVTRDLVFTVDGDTVTVAYADSDETDSFTFDATDGGFSIIGGQGNDEYRLLDGASLQSVSDGQGQDKAIFLNAVAPVTVTRHEDRSTDVSNQGSYNLSGIESLTGHISLGNSMVSQLSQSLGSWEELIAELLNDSVLSAELPLLGMSVGGLLAQGFSENQLSTAEGAATTFLNDLLTVSNDTLTGLTNLGDLADAVAAELNGLVSGELFSVAAGVHDWSELRLDLLFDATRSLTLTPELDESLTDDLAQAGLTLSAFSNIELQARLEGAVSMGVRLDELSSLNPTDAADLGFIRMLPFNLGVSASADDLALNVGLSETVFGSGAGSIGVTGGRLALAAEAGFAIDPASLDSQQRVTLGAVPELNRWSSGSLEADLPLSARLGSYDLSSLGTPRLVLATDRLFVYQQDILLVSRPDVSFDIELNATLAADILTALDRLKDSGDFVLNNSFFTTTLPGLGASLADLFSADDSSENTLNRIFNLKEAAEAYYATTTLNTGTDTATVGGLVDALNQYLLSAAAMPFDSAQADWSGAMLAYTDFGGLDLSGFDFGGADLRNANFVGADLTGANFAGANLGGAVFSDTSGKAVARQANFSSANLFGAMLAGLDLRGAVFTAADLSGADLTAASLVAANFARSLVSTTTRVQNAIFSGSAAAELQAAEGMADIVDLTASAGADLSGFDLSGVDLSGLDLSNVILTGANLTGANLQGSNLQGAELTNAVLARAFIYGAQFDAALGVAPDALAFADSVDTSDLATTGLNSALLLLAEGTSLAGFDLSGVDLSNLDFTGIDLSGTSLAGSNLNGASLAGAILSDTTDFTGASLEGVADLPSELKGIFARASLAGVDLTDTVLDGLNLAGADLTGAVLTGASLLGADLRAAIINDITAAGADAAAIMDAVTSALSGALYDSLTAMNEASAAAYQAAMAPFALDDVFTEGASGPLFAFQGGLSFSADGMGLLFNLQVNIDKQVARDFAVNNTDLLVEAGNLAPEFELAATAVARLVAALNTDLGVDMVANGGGFDTESWLRLNRLDAGARLALTGLDASLSLAGLAEVQVREGVIDLRAAAQVELADPDNADGLNRITATDISSAGGINALAGLTTTSNLRGSLLLNAAGAGFSLNDFGLPTLIFRAPELISRNADTGEWQVATPEMYLDVRITETLKDSILDLLGSIDETGNAALDNPVLNGKIPGLDKSVNELLGFDSDAGDGASIDVFKLQDAASAYLNDFGYTTNDFPSLSGLVESLNLALSRDLSIPFTTSQMDWSGFDLAGFDFGKLGIDTLRNFDFSGANLAGADFRGLDLSGVDFSGANLAGALFDGASLLRNATFDGATLTGIDWSNVDLRGLNFSGADLRGALFTGLDLSRINLSGANLSGANFSGANLRWADLVGSNLSGADLSFALALDVDWSSWFAGDLRFDANTKLTGLIVDTDLRSLFGSLASSVLRLGSGLDLSGWTDKDWSGWDLSGIDLSGINLSGFDLSGTNLRDVRFNGANLQGVNLSRALALDVDWSGVTGTLADIGGMLSKIFDGSLPSATTGSATTWASGIDLSGFDFSGWDLSGLDFGGINLGDLKLSWSMLTGVNLTGATFGAVDWTGSRWSKVTLPSGTLSGSFRNVDFGDFSFSSDITWSLTGADFVGINLTGVSGIGDFLTNINSAWTTSGSLTPLDFGWVDFSGLDLSALTGLSSTLFQFGSFRGADFSGMRLPNIGVDWNFSGLDLSLGNWNGLTVDGGYQLNLDGARLLGAALDIGSYIGTATGAFYDGLTRFGSASAEFIAGLEMDQAVLDSVFGEPLDGPRIAISPMFDTSGSEVILGFNLVSNIDQMLSFGFDFALGDVLTLGADGLARFALALDLDAGIALATRTGSTPVGDIPLPEPGDSDIFFNLNRFDTGVALELFNIQAALGTTGFAGASITEGELSVRVAASITAEDPDNTDGKGRITLSDLSAAGFDTVFDLTPAMALDGRFVLGGDLGGFNVTDWGNPVLTIGSNIVNGAFVPDYFFDVSIDAQAVRINLADLFAEVASVGSALDGSDFLDAILPFLDTSLGNLLKSEDGRTLGDLLSFQRVDLDADGNEVRTSVLADYYANADDPTYSGLIDWLRDFLGATGFYSDLESLLPSQYGESAQGPFTIGGGLFLDDQNEIQHLSIDATGGSYTLNFRQGGADYTTDAIAYNADADAVQTALREALGALFDDTTKLTVTDEGNGVLAIAFAGNWAATNVVQLRADSSNLTGGQARVTTAQQGGSRGLSLDLGLNLGKALSLPFNLGTGLDELGFALKGDGTLDLNALLNLDLSFGLAFDSLADLTTGDSYFFQARDISAQVVAGTDSFNAAVSLGVLDAEIDNGSVHFVADAGVTVKNSATAAAVGQRVSLSDFAAAASLSDLIDASATVWAEADFPLKAKLFGGDLTKLTGGENPSIEVYWGSAALPIDFDLIADTDPVIKKKNLTNLASLSNMTPAMMVQMLVNIGDFLDQFRDSEAFQIPIPFTGTDLGDAFDFAYGWTKVLNEKLQGVLSFDLTSEQPVSPRLSDDLAFDLVLQRPGDLVASSYTVTLWQADTQSFTHINELADYISGRISQATDGALQLQDSLPQWVSDTTTTDTTATDTGSASSTAVTGTAASVSEQQAGGEPVNATLRVELGTATGTLSLSYKGKAAETLAITAAMSDPDIASALAGTMATAVGTVADNIRVTGSRGEGFRIEFAGAVSGRAYTADDFSYSMSVSSTATSSVTETEAHTTGGGEVKVLTFTGYAAGTFELQLMGQTTDPIRYIADPTGTLQGKMIQQALEKIAGVGNVKVTFPQKDPLDPTGKKANYGSAPKFLIEFKGDLANQDIPDMTVYYGNLKNGTYVPAGESRGVTIAELTPGQNASGEVQTVSVSADPATPATFDLSWSYGGKTWTTGVTPSGTLSSDITASALRAALLNATSGASRLGDIDGLEIAVRQVATGSWKVSFGGILAGQELAELAVVNLSNATTPDVAMGTVQEAYLRNEVQSILLGASVGDYRVQLGSDGALSGRFAATASAAELQAVLQAMPDIGVGNVKVTGESQRWQVEFTGRLAGQDLPLLQMSPLQSIALAPVTAAAGETVTQVVEIKFADQSTYAVGVDIANMSMAEAQQALLEALEQLDGVGAGNVSVVAAPTPVGESQRWDILFTGELAGKTVQALNLNVTLNVTTGGVTQTTTEQIEGQEIRASLIQVGTSELRPMAGGLTWGKLSIRPVNVDDFTYVAIIPSAGILIEAIQTGSEVTGLSEVQRLTVNDAASGSYTLTLTFDSGDTFTTAAIAAGADAATIQTAINDALDTAGSVSVALENDQQTNVFEITFTGTLSRLDVPLLTASFGGLRAYAGAEAVAYTLQEGRAAIGEQVARDEVQRLTFNNVAGGMYSLVMQLDGSYYNLQEPLEVLPDETALDTWLTGLGIDITGLSLHEKRAVELERALQLAFTTGERAIAGADVAVVAVPGEGPSAFSYDIQFSGSIGERNLPTLLVFHNLQAVDTSTSFGNGSSALGFSATGTEAQTEIGPKFNTLEDFASVLADAINELLPSGETFNIAARFDPIAMDFMFDISLSPSLPALALPVWLDIGDLDPLASLELSGLLAVNGGVDLTTTIGLDFNRPENFKIDSGVLVSGEVQGTKAGGVDTGFARFLQDPSKPYDSRVQVQNGTDPDTGEPIMKPNPDYNPAVDTSFDVNFDGDRYRVTISAASQDDNNNLNDLLADIRTALSGVAVHANSALSRLGYQNLGQAVEVALAADEAGDEQLSFTLYGKTITEAGVAASGAFSSVFGITSLTTPIDWQSVGLPGSLTLANGSAFDLIIDGADDLASAGVTAATGDNRITVGIASGTYTPQSLMNALNTALAGITGGELGPLQTKVSHLGEALSFSLGTLPDGTPVMQLNTQGQHVASLKFAAVDHDPLVRHLGFVTDSLNKAGGVSVFLEDTLVGARLVAGVEQFEGRASIGFVDLSMDNMLAQIDAGVNVRLLDGADGNPGGRVYLDELIDAATLKDSLLGMRGEVVLNAGGSETLIAAPRTEEPGVLTEDLGLSITLNGDTLNDGQAIELDVKLLASSTLTNTSVADLADDLNTAIETAIDRWNSANSDQLSADQLAELKSHSWVTAGDLVLYNVNTKTSTTTVAGALQFIAPAVASVRVEGRRLIGEYMSPVTFSDSNYTIGSQPMARLVIDGISLDAGGLNLLPPDVDPRIDISLPIIDVWQGALSLSEAVDIRVIGADALTGFGDLSWLQVIEGLRMASNLLSQFETFSFLDQDIPVIDLSVNDMFDIAVELARAIEEVGNNPATGVGQLQAVLADSFGLPIYDPTRPEVFGVSLEYDATSNAVMLNIPYEINLLDKSYPISIDLATLGELIGGSTLQDLMGSVGSIVDVGGSALVTLQSSAMVNIALGLDLASGAMFVYDYFDGGTTDNLDDDTGTFARLGMEVNGTALAFNASLGLFSLDVKGGTADILAQAGLYLGDDPAGAAGQGDGRHYLGSAVSVLTLQDGESVALIWDETAVTTGFDIGGTGTTADAWTLTADNDDAFRLHFNVAGVDYHTQSLARGYDAATVKAYIAEALLYGPTALRGTVSVEQVDAEDPTQGWKIVVRGAGFDGKSLSLEVQQLRADADGGPLGALNEIQWVSIPSGSGGSFTLSANIDGKDYRTGDIAWNADAATVATALRTALTSGTRAIAGADVNVTLHNDARPQDGWHIEFTGSLAGRGISLLEADDGGLTHAGAVVAVPVVVSKSPGVVNQARVMLVAATSGTFDMSFGYGSATKTLTGLAWNITAEELQTRLNTAMGGGYSGILVVDDSDNGGFLISFDGNLLRGQGVTVSVDGTNLGARPSAHSTGT
ncbi:pentapeptide repeat-containing protein [Oceanisphaera psychrotolerans]|uniref:DUF4347 domain-containing protein n=1 Tax=Oceanisphaera psychrotolerans TaxID=1414654 RepID=A0A1J4QDU7_9GAMM|nr:pentapeptide repeat-containing protein [Oceanisphaera psychrotolerans]OIN06540.1 hypothetical protein BFR47_04030 [Oceanisphaera psychrotolerans]